MKIYKFNELSHLMTKDIIADIVGNEYREMLFTIEDMYKSYAEGEYQGYINQIGGKPNYDFSKWIKENY